MGPGIHILIVLVIIIGVCAMPSIHAIHSASLGLCPNLNIYIYMQNEAMRALSLLRVVLFSG